MKPNIIFLDIDGVLNTTVNPEWDNYIFDQNSIKFLRMLINECNAKLVISSTWRLGEDYLNFSQMLHIAGLGQMCLFVDDHQLGEPVKSWRTPSLSINRRGDEIDTWLEKYGNLVNDYVIIDDELHDMREHQLEKCVQTDHWCGITYREYDAVKRVLGYKNEGMTTISEMRKYYEANVTRND